MRGMACVSVMVVQWWAVWTGCDLTFQQLKLHHVKARYICAATFVLAFLIGLRLSNTNDAVPRVSDQD